MFLRTKGLHTTKPHGPFLVLTERPVPKVEKPHAAVTHHIFVLDRSGSMFNDMANLKSCIEQVFAAGSMQNPLVLTTLISFSSNGDVTLHWSAVPVGDVVRFDQPYLPILRSISATYLTGMSQGLNLALQQVTQGQTTGITLFSDGFANDPSTLAENVAIDAFVANVKANYPAVFVNCIGFRDWCDWNRLGFIANSLSGGCVRATSFRQVLDSLNDTQALLSREMKPRMEFEAGHEQQHVLLINRTTGQVNMSKAGEGLTYGAASVQDVIEVYGVTVLPANTNRAPKGHKAIPVASMWLAGALAVGFLNVGDLRTAKQILFTSGNKTLWELYQSAITPSMTTLMGEALAAWVRSGTNSIYSMGRNTLPKHDLFDLVREVNRLPPNSVALELPRFMATYRRRSIKRVVGTRQADGSLTPPKTFLRPVQTEADLLFVRSLEFNTSEATLQLNCVNLYCDVRDAEGNSVLRKIPFAPQTIASHKSYTLLSSGEWNVKYLVLSVYKKEAWRVLRPYMRGCLSPLGTFRKDVGSYATGARVVIPLAAFRTESALDEGLAARLGTLIAQRNQDLVNIKLLSAMQSKEETVSFAPDQVSLLKEYHLTPKFNYSPPTTTHYVDREKAIREGQIDSYTHYRVNFGTVSILDDGEFRSGNEFLNRRYTVTLKGKVLEKPTLQTYTQGAEYSVKPPGKQKNTPADDLMARRADELLLASPGRPRYTQERVAEELQLSENGRKVVQEILQSLVVEIGCTGMLPAHLACEATQYTSDAFEAAYPVKLGKDQKEGIFFVLPNRQHPADPVVISVVPQTAWYTVKDDSGQPDAEV